MKIIPGLLFLLIIGCAGNKPKADNQTLDFGSFSIVTPNGWTKIKAQGADSYVGRIAIDNTDTIDFDLGWYSNTLTEPEPQIIERSMLKNMDVLDTSQFIIVDSRKGIDPDKFKKNNISWDTIDGRKAQIVFPRQSGIGTTGIYIDSLLVINLSSVPGGQLVNSPTAQSLNRCMPFKQTFINLTREKLEKSE